VVIGELAAIDGMRHLAAQANALGRYDAVIHNAGVGYREQRADTTDGLEHLFAINC
jgi:NAD(P)-dependent dehydrogenase (short-subunit alcohol dehydrogenase family)